MINAKKGRFAAKKPGNKTKRHTNTNIMEASLKAPSIAAPKLLNIPELLEAILLGLPPLDLVILQRVNETFRRVINRSMSIQQKLFFKRPTLSGAGGAALNPLIGKVVRHHSASLLITSCRANPRLQNSGRSKAVCSDKFRVRAGFGIAFIFSQHGTRFLSTDLRLGSYKNMLIADGPIPVFVEDSRGVSRMVTKPDDTAILTLGQAMEACFAAVQA